MLQIPETLLQKTDKELEKILTPNKYKAKYICSDDYLYEIKCKFGDKGVMRCLNDGSLTTFDELSGDYWRPLLLSDIKEVKQDRIYKILSNCSCEEFKKYLNNLCSGIFNENEYEITIDNSLINLIIYYPEIKITNSHELEHTLRDIYVKFSFEKYSPRRLYTIAMARTTYTSNEYNKTYIFSHLDTSNGLTHWNGRFCFGSTDLSKTVANCKSPEGNLGKIGQVLMAFKDYLSWESLEGTPYKYISNLRESSSSKYTSYNEYFSNTYLEVLKEITDFKYKFTLVNGKYVIRLEKESIDKIDDLLTAKFPTKCYFLINGESKTLNSRYAPITFNSPVYTEVIFKGERKQLTVINEVDTDTNIPEKRIHRVILNGVVNHIESAFYTYIINKKLEENV